MVKMFKSKKIDCLVLHQKLEAKDICNMRESVYYQDYKPERIDRHLGILSSLKMHGPLCV